jgi:hypothetical protein
MRRMNRHPQPRIFLVLRRAYWFCVSHSSERSMVVYSRLSDAPPHDHSLCENPPQPKCTDSNGNLANNHNWLTHIQIP